MNHAALPFPIYVYVQNVHLGLNDGTTRGLWHGVHSRMGQELMCHVMLETGSHWSGIPLRALQWQQTIPKNCVSPWGAMGERIQCVHMPYLEGLECRNKSSISYRHTGIIVDWLDGYAKIPAEHKPLNLLMHQDGGYVALPNNYIAFKDKHLIDENSNPFALNYRRNEKIYWES